MLQVIGRSSDHMVSDFIESGYFLERNNITTCLIGSIASLYFNADYHDLMYDDSDKYNLSEPLLKGLEVGFEGWEPEAELEETFWDDAEVDLFLQAVEYGKRVWRQYHNVRAALEYDEKGSL